MRDILVRPALAAAMAGAVLLAGCGDTDVPQNNLLLPPADATLETPANDSSATESAVNAADPAPVDVNEADAPAAEPAGEASGGDAGGNTMTTNVAGM